MVEIKGSCSCSVRILGFLHLTIPYVQDSDRFATCTRYDLQSIEPPGILKTNLFCCCLKTCKNCVTGFHVFTSTGKIMVPPGPVNSFQSLWIMSKINLKWHRFHCCIFNNCPSFPPHISSQPDLVKTLCKQCFTLTHRLHSSPSAMMGIACGGFPLILT